MGKRLSSCDLTEFLLRQGLVTASKEDSHALVFEVALAFECLGVFVLAQNIFV